MTSPPVLGRYFHVPLTLAIVRIKILIIVMRFLLCRGPNDLLSVKPRTPSTNVAMGAGNAALLMASTESVGIMTLSGIVSESLAIDTPTCLGAVDRGMRGVGAVANVTVVTGALRDPDESAAV